MAFKKFIANFSGKVRSETLDGVQYKVVPVRILREGVMNGSRGPTFFDWDDIATFHTAWNDKPVVVYHPHKMKNGKKVYVTAASKEVRQKSRIGFITENRLNPELRAQEAEAWIDVKKARKVDPRIMKAIDRGILMELSTGLFTDDDEQEGSFNNKKYKQVARNYRPDHLALLPDQVGACSLADGCGFFTASESIPLERMEALQDIVNNAWTEEPAVNCDCQKHKGKNMKKSVLIGKLFELKAFTKSQKTELEGMSPGMLSHLLANAEAAAKEDEEEEDSEDDDDEVDANEEDDSDPAPEPKKGKGKKKAPKAVTPPKGRKKKSNVKSLMDNEETEDEEEEDVTDNEEGDEEEEAPRFKKMSTIQDVIANTDGDLRDYLVGAMKQTESQRDRYIDIITSNEDSGFTKKELKDRTVFTMERLKKLAKLACKDEAGLGLSDFFGQGGAPQVNEDEDKKPKQQHLIVHRKEYGTKKKAAAKSDDE